MGVRDQLIQAALHPVGRHVQPLQLRRRIVRQQPVDGRAAAADEHRADHDAAAQHRAAERPRHRRGNTLIGAVRGARRRQQLGQKHAHRLKDIDLVLAVLARIAVLRDQYPHHPPGAPHRHRNHRGKRLLPRLAR